MIDPEGSGGAGGTGTTTSTTSGPTVTTTTVVSSTSSGPAGCLGIEDCCLQLCDLVNQSSCPIGGDCNCGSIPGDDACLDTVTSWYQCLIANHPSSMMCVAGQSMPTCGFCDVEREQVSLVCGFEFPCEPL